MTVQRMPPLSDSNLLTQKFKQVLDPRDHGKLWNFMRLKVKEYSAKEYVIIHCVE